MQTNWLVVADEGIARIYQWTSADEHLQDRQRDQDEDGGGGLRSVQYDTVSDRYSKYLLEEILPEVATVDSASNEVVTAAAKELHYSQPSVTHHLGRLEAEPNLVDARDVDNPEAIAGRHIVYGLAVERVHDRHPAESDVLGEQIQEAAACRHHPRSLPRVDRPFEDGAGAGETERDPPAELPAVALALGHLQHA